MRKDGKLVKNVDPMYTLAPYFMRDRNDSTNAITVYVPYDNIHKYVLDARKRGYRISHMAVIMAAYVRVVSEYPELNRFVVNSKIYAHNDLTAGMVVLRPDGADPTMSKMKFDLYDTIFDVNNRIDSFVEQNNKLDSQNDSDRIFKKLLAVPTLVRIGMAIIRFCDKQFGLPRWLVDVSPFHNSMVITNLASIRTNYIFHHIYNFGTTSAVIAMGNNEDKPVMENGQVVLKKMMPMGITMDERIACGVEYAKAFARLEHYCKNPTLLEVPPEDVKVDFPFEGLSEHFKKETK